MKELLIIGKKCEWRDTTCLECCIRLECSRKLDRVIRFQWMTGNKMTRAINNYICDINDAVVMDTEG